MGHKDNTRKKLQKALKAASEQTNIELEGPSTRGCCTITAGDVTERSGNITEEACNIIANTFGGVANFQANVNC